MNEATESTRAADGGNVTFDVGAGWNGGKDGHFLFQRQGVEVLRIDPDGGFYVEGRKVTDDLEVYKAFKNLLLQALTNGITKP